MPRETGLYYLQSRYYNPEWGRFINADDPAYLGADGTPLSYNLFAYCGNNPVSRVDPTGEWSWETFWVGAGMVATAATAIALSVTTFGAGIPLAMSIVAGVTLGAGVLTGINGTATLIEAWTDYNFVRDGVFQGNETAYSMYAGITEGVAAIGCMVLGAYQSTGHYKAAKYGQKYLGNGYRKADANRWISKDGMRQMIFDDTHHMLDGVKTTNHFNLSTHASDMRLGRSPIVSKLHVFYDAFSIWFK